MEGHQRKKEGGRDPGSRTEIEAGSRSLRVLWSNCWKILGFAGLHLYHKKIEL